MLGDRLQMQPLVLPCEMTRLDLEENRQKDQRNEVQRQKTQDGAKQQFTEAVSGGYGYSSVSSWRCNLSRCFA